MEIFMFICWVLIAWWNVSIAKKNGRNPIWAAIWGVLFGLLAVIIYAIAGKTRLQEEIDFSRRLAMSNAASAGGSEWTNVAQTKQTTKVKSKK